jgi:C-terminal peptidase prc
MAGRLLLAAHIFIFIFLGAGLPRSLQAADNLTPENVSFCIPELLNLHLLQHNLDTEFMKRILKQFVMQLDPGKVFFLKDEAEAATAMSDVELRTLAVQAATGDFSHFNKMLQDFLNTQIVRDAALFDGLANRKEEIKALAEEKAKSVASAKGPNNPLASPGGADVPANLEDDVEKIEWSERAATQADREKRILRITAAFYKLNTSYLSENEAFKLALQSVCEWRNLWLKVDPAVEVPKLFMKSFMSALDPHSEYFEAEKEDDITDRLERSFAGIGVQIRPCPLGAFIEEVIKGGPSDKSGKFSRGDLIIAVDNISLAGLSIDKIVKKIKGQLGSEVKLSVLKRANHNTENITLKREEIKLADMRVKDKEFQTPEGVIAVIYVQSFYKDVHKDVRDKIRALSAAKPLAGVVLDLRSNLGGYLDEAISLTSLFIEPGPVVGERDGRGMVDWRHKELGDPPPVYLGPLVVLVNQVSASASEIVSGSLKDYGRAVIVGATQTFGKGTVQRIIPLERYNLPGAIRITTQQYFLAGGDSVQLRGVEPDVLIPGPKLLEEDGMLERVDKNAVPWNSIPSEMDRNAPEIKLWHAWKDKNVTLLQEKSKARVAANPAFKDAFNPKKAKPPEPANLLKERGGPDEPPPLEDLNKEEPDLQAQEAVDVVKDMLSSWPKR